MKVTLLSVAYRSLGMGFKVHEFKKRKKIITYILCILYTISWFSSLNGRVNETEK
jgi:hypothetical protein